MCVLREVGNFRLLRRISSSSLGEVFVGQNQKGRGVAVTVLRAALAEDLAFSRAIRQDTPGALAFRHPRSAGVRSVLREGQEHLIVSELAAGISLGELQLRLGRKNQKLSHRIIAWLGAQLAELLSDAHAFEGEGHALPGGLIHAGLSPEEIILSESGEMKLLRLGLGRCRRAVKTPWRRQPYEAPEAIKDQTVTPQTDTYGLGVVLYDAFLGKSVFLRNSQEATRSAILEAQAPVLNSRNLDVNPDVGDLLASMMAPRAMARPRELREVARLLWEASLEPSESLQKELAGLVQTEIRELRSEEVEPDIHPSRAVFREEAAGVDSADLDPEADASKPRSPPPPPVPKEAPKIPAIPPMPKALPPLPSVKALPAREDRPDIQSDGPTWSLPSADPLPKLLESLRQDPARAAELPNWRLGRYRLHSVELLPDQGVALFRAHDLSLERWVWLSVIDGSEVPRSWVNAVKRQARLQAGLSIPGLPMILDVGRADSLYFVVQDLRGESLKLGHQRAPVLRHAAIAGLISELSWLLAELHEQGLMHGGLRFEDLLYDGQHHWGIRPARLLHRFDKPVPWETRRLPKTPEAAIQADHEALGLMLSKLLELSPDTEKSAGSALAVALNNVELRLLSPMADDGYSDLHELSELLEDLSRSEAEPPMTPGLDTNQVLAEVDLALREHGTQSIDLGRSRSKSPLPPGEPAQRPRFLIAWEAPPERLNDLLEARGFDVLTCDDGIEAWEALSSGLFGHVVLSESLTGFSGRELSEKIQNHPATQGLNLYWVGQSPPPRRAIKLEVEALPEALLDLLEI